MELRGVSSRPKGRVDLRNRIGKNYLHERLGMFSDKHWLIVVNTS